MARGIELDLKSAIDALEREKGIDRKILVDAITASVISAAKKKFTPAYDMEAVYDEDTGEVSLFRWVRIVDEVPDDYDDDIEVSLEFARQQFQDPEVKASLAVGDEVGLPLEVSWTDFGRIAAQAAKQVIIQRVRKAERDLVFNEYKDRKGEIVTGVIRRFERRDVVVDLGRAEAILIKPEQIPQDFYRTGDRIQAYIQDVRDGERNHIIFLSRTDEGFLIKLFEMEVPEIYDGIVSIVSAARDPGVRAKIAVTSRDMDVDPVGACVGVKGARVQAVVHELKNEKIDIVPYSEDPARFVCNAIAPAQVSRVIIDEEKHMMELIVPDDQQSLAIGRKGQNVRLAAKLTGWNIDIISEKQVTEAQDRAFVLLSSIDPSLSKELLLPLLKLGYRSVFDIDKAGIPDLAIIPGIGAENAEKIKNAAARAVELEENGEGDALIEESRARQAGEKAEAQRAAIDAPADVNAVLSQLKASLQENMNNEDTSSAGEHQDDGESAVLSSSLEEGSDAPKETVTE